MNEQIQMTQEQILIHNIKCDYLCRHYKKSPPQSLGQILSYIYVFCGFDVMEKVQVGDGKVYLHGTIIATFKFNQFDVPYFYFLSSYERAKQSGYRQELFFDEIFNSLKEGQ